MTETKRLGPWGWFVRAFAAGFGAMCGVIVASVVACAVCYALIAAGVLAFTSLTGADSQTSGTLMPLPPAPTTTVAPAYPTTVEPSPYVGSPYGGSNPYATDRVQSDTASRGDSMTGESPTYGNSTTAEAGNGAPVFNAQPASPVTIPSEPIPSPDDGSSTLERPSQKR